MQQNYDPMLDFYKRLFPFLFRQAPVIVFMAVAGLWLVRDREGLKGDFRAEIVQAKAECSAAIADVRQELRVCRLNNDTLVRRNVELSLRIIALEIRKNKKR